MLRNFIATAAISTSLIVSLGATKAQASSDFKAELPRAAASKPMTGAVSVTSQTTSPFHLSLSQFEKFGLRCESNGSHELPALVTEVGSNSPAYFKGLQAGDGILALKGSAESYSLTIDRNGKIYAVSLSASDLNPNAILKARARQGDVVLPVAQRMPAVVEVNPFISQIAADRHNGVIQGAQGNCWFEASLSAVADSANGPEFLASMIKPSSQSYMVHFPNRQIVTVTENQIATSPVRDPAQWARILELAEMSVYPDNAPAQGAMIGNPGVKVGLELLTGRPVSFIRPDSISTGELSDLLDRLHSQGQPVTMASKSPMEHHQRVQPVIPNHAYSLVNFDRNNGLITLRNPLGTPGPQSGGMVQLVSNDEIQIDLQTFSTFFRFVAYPN